MSYIYFLFLIVSIFSFLSTDAIAQQFNEQEINTVKAEQLFIVNEYKQAIKIYKKVYEKEENDKIARKIAACYFYLKDFKHSKQWYELAKVRGKGGSPEAVQQYAILLQKFNREKEALNFFGRMQSTLKNQTHIANKEASLEKLSDPVNSYFQDSVIVDIGKFTWNTKKSELAPKIFNDSTLVFAVSSDEKLGDSLMSKNVKYNLFKASIDSSALLENYKFQKFIPELENPSSFCFYNDSKSMIVTKNINIPKRIRKNIKKTKTGKLGYVQGLFSSHYNEETKKWSDPKPLDDINSFLYSTGNPTITNDGTFMIFSSDMPGGFGSTDLYKVNFENGKWGTPINLGTGVNTEGRENFPFVYKSSIFFSSDRKDISKPYINSDLDIYRAYLLNGKYVRQLLNPVNSDFDDFGITFNKTLSYCYFSSNRDGNDDIFRADLTIYGSLDYKLSFVDEYNQPIKGVEVNILDEELSVKYSYISNYTNQFKLNENKIYIFRAYKKGYYFAEELVVNTLAKGLTELSKTIVLKQTTTFYSFVGNKDKNIGVANAAITVENLNTGRKQLLVSSDTGYFKINVEPLTAYIIKVKKEEYFNSQNFFTGISIFSNASNNLTYSNIPLDILKKLQPHKNTTNEVPNLSDIDKEIMLNNTDYNKNLNLFPNSTSNGNVVTKTDKGLFIGNRRLYTPETATNEELKETFGFSRDKGLIGIIHHNFNEVQTFENIDNIINKIKEKLSTDTEKKLVVSVVSTTDARGNFNFNFILSNKRAHYVKNKLFMAGIPIQRINPIGVGESILQNECHRDAQCNEEEHSKNRVTIVYLQEK